MYTGCNMCLYSMLASIKTIMKHNKFDVHYHAPQLYVMFCTTET